MLMDRYPDAEDARRDGDSKLFDGAARYVGETLRRNLGGTWGIELQDKSSVHYAKPTLANFRNFMPPVCPTQWLFTAVQRQRGDFMRRVVMNYGTGE